MKKIAAFLTALCCLMPMLLSCANPAGTVATQGGATNEPTPPEPETALSSSSEAEELPEADQVMKYEFGVYNVFTADKEHKMSLNRAGSLVLDDDRANSDRFTLHIKERVVNGVRTKFYAIYVGDNTSQCLGITSFLPASAKLQLTGGGYQPADKALWTVEDYEDGTCRIIPKTSLADQPICLAVRDGTLSVAPRADETDLSQLFRIEKAPEHTKYKEYRSDKGNFIVRVNRNIVNKKSTGIDDEMMQNWANYMQEAYEAEITLTGFVPYDLIVFSGWEDINLAAGVSDNYNVITAGASFAASEFTKMAARNKNKSLGMIDMSFGFLHELGHMFDSGRGWNFESEAWTDLKLCYVIYKMTEDHKKTDGKVFGCASADYDASRCFTYETQAEALDIHAHKGAMTTVYGFFGAARLFLLMAYDFGWDPFIRTFHWYQDNGYTANSFARWERFTTFVDKLSEYSGKDIKKDYLTEENWEVFRRYYQGETTEAV